MNKGTLLRKIEEILEVGENFLTGEERLDDLEDWDSLAVMAFIAMVDKNFNTTLETDKISKCTTINDLFKLLGDLVSDN